MDVRYAFSILALYFLALLFASPLSADTILEDFQVNIEPPGHPDQKSPLSVARWETETIFVTWLSFRDGVNWDVALNRFDYDLEPLGDAIYLNIRQGTYDCKQPRLALSAAGFGAAWIEEDEPNRIMFRSYDDNVNPFSQPVSVAEEIGTEPKDSLSIAALGNGYLLVWYDERDSSSIYAQKVNFDGGLIGDNFAIRPDSTGTILGLEAQNHPDGRVLVSWVTVGQYSRGRWLDNTGNFMGDVFEMAAAWPSANIYSSLVRFDEDGFGMLFQYSDSAEYYGASASYRMMSYITYLDNLAHQSSNRIEDGYWKEYHEDRANNYNIEVFSFPDIIFLPDSNHCKTRLYRNYGYASGSSWDYSYNRLFSSILNNYVVPYGISQEGQYDLCRITGNSMLYTFGVGSVGLRVFEISTLDSSQSIEWISESDCGVAQFKPKVAIHSDGAFRIIYDNVIGPYPQLYTRYFDEYGVPSSVDTLVSMDIDLNPVFTSEGWIRRTANNEAIVIWEYNHDTFGTIFSGSEWSENISRFYCDFPVEYINGFDINDSFHLNLLYTYCWDLGGGDQRWYLYCKSYTDFINSSNLSFLVSYHPWNAQQGSISLRNDGRFLNAWMYPYGSYVYLQPGIDYFTIAGDSINTGTWTESKIALEKSNSGYWSAWRHVEEIKMHQYDIDGIPASEVQVISSEDAIASNKPALTISDSSNNFAICWQDERNDEGDIYCRQFNPDGTTYGREYRVNSDPVGPLQKEPAVAFGPNDQLYFTWTDFRNEGGQGDIYCKVIEWEDATAVTDEPEPVPYEFALYKAFPNPFNPITTLTFSLPVASNVRLEVYDINGRRVGIGLVPTRLYSAGIHHVLFDGSDLASGIYFVRMQAGEFTKTKKLVLMK